jgi:hypothetical protein
MGRNKLARLKKIKKPMISVIAVTKTDEARAGSCPANSRIRGASVPTILATSIFPNRASPSTSPR